MTRWLAATVNEAATRWPLALLLLLALTVAATTEAAIPASERQALIDLYNGTNGAAWTQRTNWRNGTNTDFNDPGTECTWYGVSCTDDTTVRVLYLTNNNLVGTLPASFASLTNVAGLYLDVNKFGGSIPSVLGSLTNLQILNLAANRFTGPIPAWLGSLTTLQGLDLKANQLTGAIPTSLWNLTNLQGIDLRWNALYSTDPTLTTFLNSRQVYGDWQSTQTVAPVGVYVGSYTITATSVELWWWPIAFIGSPDVGASGGYRAFYSTTSGGPYTSDGITADKSANGIVVSGLSPGTVYYFIVRTITNPHFFNMNTETSDPSNEVYATTSGSACTSPSITGQPQSQAIQSGQTATLSVTATGTTPLSHQWYRGSASDTSHPVGGNASTLTTPALTAATSYWVRVSNTCGHADSATATVSISCAAPSITTQPQSQSIGSGQTATLSVTATGSASLSYQWYRGSASNTSQPVGTNASSFTTPALTAAASYWVRVSNTCGHADSATAAITVTSGCTAPSITGQAQSQSIQSGQTATLSVTATGTAPLSYQWYQGSSGAASNPVGTNASSFTTPALTATTTYWVRVTNACGHADSATATVTVASAPVYVVWVPVVARNPGLNQSQWRSDLGLLNTGSVTANAQITFYGGGGVTTTTYVPAGTQSILTDVVGQLGASGQGALEVRSDQPLKVTSRTYNQVPSDATCYPNGTQGQDYPALAESDGLAPGQSAYLAGLTENASYRCNIGLVNVGPGLAEVLVELYDGAGTKLGDYAVLLTEGLWVQDIQPFRSRLGQTSMDRGYAKITVLSGSGVFAFASVVDNLTNDPTTVAMQR